MKLLYKYPIERPSNTYGVFKILIRQHANIVTAKLQNDTIVLYAEIYEDEPTIEREIEIIGTGHKVPIKKYLTTIEQGSFMWHIYI